MKNSMVDLIQRAANEIMQSNHAIALTGAGFSTESGIPDYRGPEGIWTRHPELELKAYEAYEDFQRDPKKWWIDQLNGPVNLIQVWGKAKPNPGHLALVELEETNQLKRVLTQNIDNLHQIAGSKKVIDYHGNITKLRCLTCNNRYPVEQYDFESMKNDNRLPPRCKSCGDPLKPDVVYFGEPIPPDVSTQSEQEAFQCDLMMICGTSAVVYPFAGLPIIALGKQRSSLNSLFTFGLKSKSPAVIIEINNEPTPLTHKGISDYLIQGKTGEILPQIVSAVRDKI
jgi:NAD-dependent deacetylase